MVGCGSSDSNWLGHTNDTFDANRSFVKQGRRLNSLVCGKENSDTQVRFRSKAASSQSRLDLVDMEGLFCDTDCDEKGSSTRSDSRLVGMVAVQLHHEISVAV